VHNGNRLETCQSCHVDATEGYVTFQPHGTTNNFDEYPQMWLASKGMIGLLLGTFSFFWLHSALWFYREYQDRKHGKDRPHILTEALPQGKTHFRRFTRWWRLAHLVGAISIMLLALTGITVLFSGSSWAPVVMSMLGGPTSSGVLHRIGAVGFMSVFFIHLIYFAFHISRNWRTFDWFGPNSLVPNWDDLGDAIAMFRWFFGLGPRPILDHFSYWEKFDYWAPFWGMTIIGVSGMMMWFPLFMVRKRSWRSYSCSRCISSTTTSGRTNSRWIPPCSQAACRWNFTCTNTGANMTACLQAVNSTSTWYLHQLNPCGVDPGCWV